MKKSLSIVLVLAMLCTWLPQITKEVDAAQIDDASDIDGYSYSTAYGDKLNKIFQGKVSLFSDTTATYPLGSSINNSHPYVVAQTISGKQCYIYAQAVYYYLFGDIVYHGNGYVYWSDSVKLISNKAEASYNLFANAGVGFGAYMRTTVNTDGSYSDSGHSMIVLGYDTSGITYLEGNADGAGFICVTTRTWSNFNQEMLSKKGRRLGYVVQCKSAMCNHKFSGVGVCTKCDMVYDWESTLQTTEIGKYKILDDFTPRTDKPYDAATQANFCMGIGAIVDVIGVYTNAYGNKWYKFKSGGQTYYGYDDDFEFVEYFDQAITGTITFPQDGATLTPGVYTLKGKVTSQNYPIQRIDVFVDGHQYSGITLGNRMSYSLEESSSMSTLDFSALAPGDHRITVQAKDIHHISMTNFDSNLFTIKENSSYTVSFTDTGDTTMSSITVNAGDSVTIPNTVPHKFGYNFDGWECNGTVYQPGETFTPSGNMTLDGDWRGWVTSFTDWTFEREIQYAGVGYYFDFYPEQSGYYTFRTK